MEPLASADADHPAASGDHNAPPSQRSKPFDPTRELRALVRSSMLARFDPRTDRLALLRDVRRSTHMFAARLLVAAEPTGIEEEREEQRQTQYMLPTTPVAPPSAFFAFRENGRMHLPIIDWAAFRGYSVALWIHVDHMGVTTVKPSDEHTSQSSEGKFTLFRFVNNSGTLGVEATLERDADANQHNGTLLLSVSSGAPAAAEQRRFHQSAAAILSSTSVPSTEWKRVQHRVRARPNTWHLLVISHSLHYVKKSKVSCYVDAALQFRDELVYPSGLVTASKCTVGGGKSSAVKVASATMYKEELSAEIVAMLYRLGPSVSSFNRWGLIPPSVPNVNANSAANPLTGGFHEAVIGESSVAVPDCSTAWGELCKTEVVFSFTAQNVVNEDYDDLGVEWVAEGAITSGGTSKWIALESTVGVSAEIQQRNARIGKNVQKLLYPDCRAAWYRTLGLRGVIVLLDYVLAAYDSICEGNSDAGKSDFSASSDAPGVVESIVVDLLWSLKGLLLNSPVNQQTALQQYTFHMLAHVLCAHQSRLASIWTPGSLVVLVEMVRSLYDMLPLPASPANDRVQRDGGAQSLHPFHSSAWQTTPLFASAVRAILLDYRLWTRCDYKTQSIFTHQLYGLACEYPHVFNDLQGVEKVLEILAKFYAADSNDGATATTTARGGGGAIPTGADSASQNSQQFTEQTDKERHWKQQCIQTLVEIIEVCLTNQSVQVHEVLEEEVLETTSTVSSATINAASTGAVSSAGNTTGSGSAGGNGGASGTSTGLKDASGDRVAQAAASVTGSARRGGVLSISLENIVWSDQDAAQHASATDSNAASTASKYPSSVLNNVQIRFSLLRDLRAIVRFLLTSDDAEICSPLLLLLRRLCVSFLDMRFGLVSSSLVDCLLFLMQPLQETENAASATAASPTSTAATHGWTRAAASSSVRVRMACVPVLIYLLDWLRSVEGRTVWCGIEEHLRAILNGDGNFSVGFLELMMEFYFDPAWRIGVQHSIIMNDPTKKDSVLFPIASSAGKPSLASIHDNSIVPTDSGIGAASTGGVGTGVGSGSSSGGSGGDPSGMGLGVGSLTDWIKLAGQFVGKKRLALAWEKRVAVIRMTALRSLSGGSGGSSPGLDDLVARDAGRASHGTLVADLFDEGVSGMLSLPLRGVLPFLPILLSKSSAHFREKVLMDINIELKTDEALQDQLLALKRHWADALLELTLVCSLHEQGDGEQYAIDSVGAGSVLSSPPISSTSTTPATGTTTQAPSSCGRAYSVDASKTGEDLVLDTIVSLLCRAMNSSRGWRSMTHVILSLKGIQQKYEQPTTASSSLSGGTSTVPASSIPPAVTYTQASRSELLTHPLHWLCRATGIVLQRMARSRTILSRVLAENVQRLLFLAQETLLASPFSVADAPTEAVVEVTPPSQQTEDGDASPPLPPSQVNAQSQTPSSRCWSDAQLFLLNAVLDMNVRLMQSTHKMHRVGLAPGLQILQRALPYVADAAMMQRIVETLIESFQQEMGPVAALKVYESIPTRDVFLSALVCLRRALISHGHKDARNVDPETVDERKRSLALLRGLTLRICTSGAFADDLHAAGVTVQALSTLSEAEAVGVVLDALALPLNDTELHEREEAADMVPYFPSAQELRASMLLNESSRSPTPGSGGSLSRLRTRSSSVEALDDGGERVLWAALEVEENRMLQSLETATRRERDRVLAVRTRFAPRRRAWAKTLWLKHEFIFRTEHEHEALQGAASDVLDALHRRRVWRIASFESAFPARTRRALDVDFLLTAHASRSIQPSHIASKALLTDGDGANGGDTSSDTSSSSIKHDLKVRRHQSLTLELIHGLDEIVTNSPLSSPVAKAGGMLLERVGRVVAEQGGGEIPDITSDDMLPSSEEKGSGVDDPDLLAGELLDDDEENEQLLQQARERAASKAVAVTPTGSSRKADESASSSTSSSTSAPTATTTVSVRNEPGAVYMDEQDATGVDPGAGMGVSVDDQVYARVRCRRVIAEGIVQGHLFVCGKHLVFIPQQPSSSDTLGVDDGSDNAHTPTSSGGLGSDRKGPSTVKSPPAPSTKTTPAASARESGLSGDVSSDEAAPGLHRCWRWKYGHVVGAYLRRYRLRDSALELFFRNGSSHFLDFPASTKSRRNEIARLLYSFLPRSVPKQWPGRVLPHLASTTKAWQNRQISNFDYLMALNTFAGRSFNDLTQYPVFPWVLADYESEILDLSDPSSFRDLSKPVGALNPERLQEYWDRYHSFDDPVIPKFLYGSHYSTCAGVVLFFLFRLEPFASLHKKMQGGTFDLADRLFDSIQETWRMCNSQMSEVKELTPEFFSDPSFLRNVNRYDFGRRHDQRQVSDVRLPPWAGGSPEQFVRLHRAALESEMVSRHLHEWVDLIFGFKQRGRAALQANNVFYYLTYYGVVDLDQIEDPFLRESMELQIAHFGQCPMQLFTSSHPKRHPMTFTRKLPTAAVNAASALSAAATGGSVAAGSVGGSNAGGGGANSGNASGGAGNSGPVSYIPKPLSQAFKDATPAAQERRKVWSPVVAVKPIAKSGIRLLKILPDRVVSVNELGVIELFHWKLTPKPRSSEASDDAVPTSPPPRERWADAFAGPSIDEAAMIVEGKAVASEDASTRASDDGSTVEFSPVPASGPMTPTNAPSCPWLLEITRDDSPFDYVPRVPVFEHHGHLRRRHRSGFPVAITSNGRVIVSGGARNGALHLRLLDLDNGHVVGKASVVGHAAAVTCLSMDKWSYATAPPSQQDDEQLLVSGSADGTLAVWRLSRVKPDLLFRLPRISPSPIMVLRGHAGAVLDCCVSSYLSLVLSCTANVALAHFLYNDGQVSFTLEPASTAVGAATRRGATRAEFSHVRISSKGYMLTVTRVTQTSADDEEDDGCGGSDDDDANETEAREEDSDSSEPKKAAASSAASGAMETVVASVCNVYNLLGVLVGSHALEDEDITDMQLSAEGDLVILTLFPGTIRICRTEEYVPPRHSCAQVGGVDGLTLFSVCVCVCVPLSFVVVQEYEPSPPPPAISASPVSAMCVGPKEAVILLAAGHDDGTLVLQLLPDADGSVSFLSNVRRLLGVSSKLKMVKGTVQQAQSLAMSTLGSAKAVTSTARDIAGEALGEAKVMMRGLFSYLQQKQNPA